MNDRRTDFAIDAVLNRLDVPADPAVGFVNSSMAQLLPQVRQARRQDRSWARRLARDVRLMFTAPRRWQPVPSPRVMLLGAVALLLLLVAVAAVIVGSARRLPAPFGFARNGNIAYVAGGHIFVSDGNGAARRQITFDPGSQVDPSFSRDGTRLAYRRVATLQQHVDVDVADAVVANADGSKPVVVARGVRALSHIAWSPDGRFVAFSGFVGGGAESGWIVPSDGSAPPTSFTSLPGAWDPVWAPDGTKLAIGVDPGQLWVVNRDGSGARRVSHGTYEEVGQKGEIAEWSPDGSLILFTAGDAGGPTQIYVVGLDGADERRITQNTDTAANGSWSPDGNRIAYMRAGTGSGPLVTIADPTGRILRILRGQYGWYQPVWSPDGTKLIITDDRPGPANIVGPAVAVILDVGEKLPPVEIPAPADADNNLPDWTGSWQRLAP